MDKLKVTVFTPEGKIAGYFLSPTIEMMPPHHYIIRGNFYDESGYLADRIEFNPEVMPYTVDLSAMTKCDHQHLVRTYVERGRQPVEMAGYCRLD